MSLHAQEGGVSPDHQPSANENAIPRRNVNAVAEDVVIVEDDVAHVNIHAELAPSRAGSSAKQILTSD
jgi:hypothetical protein